MGLFTMVILLRQKNTFYDMENNKPPGKGDVSL